MQPLEFDFETIRDNGYPFHFNAVLGPALISDNVVHFLLDELPEDAYSAPWYTYYTYGPDAQVRQIASPVDCETWLQMIDPNYYLKRTFGPDRSSVALWPNLPALANLLGVSPTLLAKPIARPGESPLRIVPWGNELHYSPSAVLTLADHYQRRAILSVASDLVTYAELAAERDELETLELDIQGYLQATRTPAPAGPDPGHHPERSGL